MDPFTHEVLYQQHEERLARKMARYEAVGFAGPGRLSLRRPAANFLRAVANHLAPQAEPASALPAEPNPNHYPILPTGDSQITSKG